MRMLLLVVVLVVALTAACGDDADEAGSTDDDAVLVLTDDDIGAEVDLAAGERFEVHLDSNPTTGYGWELAAMTTEGVVTLESSTYLAPDTDLMGAGGTEVFVFMAGDEGAGVLRLEYVRSFEDPMIPARVAEFIVRIDGAPWPS